MTLIKFKPTATRESLRDSMIPANMMSLFDSFFTDHMGKFERNTFFTPRIDIAETSKSFEVSVALPGLKKDEISIDVDADVLAISGERKLKNENAKFHSIENFYGKFSRSFTLPENINKSAITAELNDGVLKIELPKTEVKESKSTIVIK